ncbi:hypothetical protein [Xanthomonas theicola]|uniref:hypothetical protein n=1 Tax=Xanthomonas theicola TaxID=56464 RepID=UPI001B8053EA|nr:hypothetical protein [Xanthomonas theicola]
MKITDLPSLRLSAGHLTVWRVCGPPMSAAQWASDPRRASHVQEATIRYVIEEADKGALPPSWLGCAFDLPAELDAHAFAAALRSWIDRHEILRSHLAVASRSAADGGLRRMTLPAATVDIHPSAAGAFTDSGALVRYLGGSVRP